MANTFYRNPTVGGDEGSWGSYDQENRAVLPINTCKLFDDSGTLKVKKGRIGIDNGSLKGSIIIDTETTINMAAVSNSNWAKIEVSISGSSVTFEASDISGATDESQIPTTLTNNYDEDKNGYYLTATKRTIGTAYKDSGGNLSSIINCLDAEDYQVEFSAGGVTRYIKGQEIWFNNILHVIDEKSPNTNGGASTTGSYLTRTLNTTRKNTIQGASLASNQITLPPGEYVVSGHSEYFTSGVVKTRVRNVTDSATVAISLNIAMQTANSESGQSILIKDTFTIASQKVFELQYRATNAQAANGLGVAANLTENEIYAEIFIERIG